MTKTVQAPRTVGPNLAELTVREQAAAAWAREVAEGRHRAERAALALARTMFGNAVPIEFDDFVPESFARRHHYLPAELVTFDVEGLEFNYADRHQRDGREVAESFVLIDRCPGCEDGVRLLATIRALADLGRAWETIEFDTARCADCRAKARAEEDAARFAWLGRGDGGEGQP